MKAMLVIDMPKNCYDCQYCRFDARRYNFRGCVLADTDVQDGTIDILKEVHSCCPLKPLPRELDYASDWEDVEIIFRQGWNACLEEIRYESNVSD